MDTELSNENNHSDSVTVKIIYVLYLVGVFTGLTALVGLVMAYINKSDAPDWLRSHYQFQIRTFWIGLLCMFVGMILSVVLVGYLILFLWLIWLVIRCVKGLKQAGKNSAMPNPKTWLF